MGSEINLLKNYPRTRRETAKRASAVTSSHREVARQFGKEFFDGDRLTGYGGFSYQPRFWAPVLPDFINFYNLTEKSKLLDVGCAKGFMLYDFSRLLPGIDLAGIDISYYAIEHSKEEVRSNLCVGSAAALPWKDNSFDLVISINTIHNLKKSECAKALSEIQRVSKRNCFITVDAYRDHEEKKRMFEWNLTAKTILHVDEWKAFFRENNYEGDFYWFTP